MGSTAFSEQIILATLYGRCLEAAGYQVQVRINLGPQEVVEPLLERGEIDLYPEYLNSAILFLSGQSETATDDPIESAAILRRLLEPKLDAVSAELTTHDLSELNRAVDIDKEHPRDAATRWLGE